MDVYGKRTSSVFKLNDGYVFVLLVINSQTKNLKLKLLKLKSVGSDQSIFSKMFVKLLSIYTPGDDCKLVRMNMWFSTELKDFLGKFTAPTAWAPVAPFHHVVKHGFALEEVVFEVSFPSEKKLL